jgi:uncharacterized protein
MPLDFDLLAPLALIMLVTYVVFGMTGFGSALVAVPLMAHFVPIQFVIPTIVLLDCLASLTLGLRLRGEFNKPDTLALAPFVAVGMVIGGVLLARTPAGVILPFLAVFVTGYGLFYMFRHESVFRIPRWTAAPIGLFAGTMSSLFGMAGPIYVMYLVGRGATPEQVRATMPVIFIFTTIGRIAVFVTLSLLTTDTLFTAALLVPAMAAGLWLGNRWHARISRAQAVRVIGALLTLSGLSLLLKAF